jgi:hypothetical protein
MRYGRTGPRRSRKQELNGTVEPSRRSPDGHRASGIRHRLLGAGVTIAADYPPCRVIDGGPLAIPHALGGGVRNFFGPG